MRRILFLIIIGLYPIYVFSQEPKNLTGTELRDWSISCYLAGPIGGGGPAKNIEDAMRAAEFDRRSPAGFFGPGRNHPSSEWERFSWVVSV